MKQEHKDAFGVSLFNKLRTPDTLDKLHERIEAVLRYTCALCFIGHGAWGVITKAGWLPFFASQGIPEHIAWKLMPLVGSFDIFLGILLIFRPMRAVMIWMALWCLWTALLRPISGASTFEVWERAGNFGPPIIMLILAGSFLINWKDLFSKVNYSSHPKLTEAKLHNIDYLMRFFLALLLVGHGGFGLFVQKDMLIQHWSAIGINANVHFIMGVGAFEFLLAGLVLFKPSNPILYFVLAWKLFSEMLYPISGSLVDTWEFIERWGDYGLPISMIYINQYRVSAAQNNSSAETEGNKKVG